MKIYRDLDNLPIIKNAVLTIGSYDGVHIGHQKIIKKINDLAKSIGGQSVLITFYPHPRLIVSNDSHNLRLLNTLEEKISLLKEYKIDVLVIVPFSLKFAAQSPDQYIVDFLVANFKPSIITIGYDHKFGKNREGNISYLKKFEEQYKFRVIEISKQEVADIAVSSTKVRNALYRGEVSKASQLLGHVYSIQGKVVKGTQIGNKIGFPTANIEVSDKHKLIPPAGIYAVHVYHDNTSYHGMLYIGNRPTINKDLEQTIEVNIFDFNLNIYGHILKIDFVEFLRSDKKFNSLEELQIQLQKDKDLAQKVLN
ncbi:MAG: bifunctional riboflavin kinase/FAD synthetase [Saprospiraceae bacterium]|nr:bifunctional riboflavin kinase/FAD synthetase [Saprospiraceae bacterium]